MSRQPSCEGDVVPAVDGCASQDVITDVNTLLSFSAVFPSHAVVFTICEARLIFNKLLFFLSLIFSCLCRLFLTLVLLNGGYEEQPLCSDPLQDSSSSSSSVAVLASGFRTRPSQVTWPNCGVLHSRVLGWLDFLSSNELTHVITKHFINVWFINDTADSQHARACSSCAL